VTLGWSLLGLVLIYGGSESDHRTLRILGYAVLGLAVLRSLLVDSYGLAYPDRTLSFLSSCVASFVAAHVVGKNKNVPVAARASLSIGGTLLLTVFLAIECLDPSGMLAAYSSETRLGVLSVLWALEGLTLLWASQKVSNETLRIASYCVLAGTALLSVQVFSFFGAYPARTIGSLASVLALFAAAKLIDAQPRSFEESARIFLRLGGYAMLVLVLARELTDAAGLFSFATETVRQVSLSLAWAIEAIVLVLRGFRERLALLRGAGILLFVITILKVLAADLSGLPTLARVVVTIVIGIIALGASFAYVRNKDSWQDATAR
jgi:uncharacterized membrane protein